MFGECFKSTTKVTIVSKKPGYLEDYGRLFNKNHVLGGNRGMFSGDKGDYSDAIKITVASFRSLSLKSDFFLVV